MGVIPSYTGTKQADFALDIFPQLEKDEAFRQFSIENLGCFNKTLAGTFFENYIPDTMDYVFCSGASASYFPAEEVIAETMLLAGTFRDYKPRIVRLYYWNR